MKMSNSILIAVLVLLGCQKAKEQIYSCDPGINTWTVQNAARFENFTRADLAAIQSIDSQRGVYRSLSPTGKSNIWKEKLSDAISTYEMTVAEKAHVQALFDYLKPDIYVDSASLDAVQPYLNKWATDAQNNFGWDSTKLFVLSETWLTQGELESFYQRAVREYSSGQGPDKPIATGSSSPDCGCNSSLGCAWFSERCGKSPCTTTSGGCGIIGTSNCRGMCESTGFLGGKPLSPFTIRIN